CCSTCTRGCVRTTCTGCWPALPAAARWPPPPATAARRGRPGRCGGCWAELAGYRCTGLAATSTPPPRPTGPTTTRRRPSWVARPVPFTSWLSTVGHAAPATGPGAVGDVDAQQVYRAKHRKRCRHLAEQPAEPD